MLVDSSSGIYHLVVTTRFIKDYLEVFDSRTCNWKACNSHSVVDRATFQNHSNFTSSLCIDNNMFVLNGSHIQASVQTKAWFNCDAMLSPII
ncbi:hypothetical protein GOP47_0028567 [Adiantum capillus-veneris]|nr:hypothetical protein GOP47_0028567 [Adiantum capillus-veneris]